MIPKTLEFTTPNRLPEANIQAELYRQLRNNKIKCCLEYRMFSSITDSFIRADVITIQNNRILSIIECKSRGEKFEVNRDGIQYQRYRAFGIPIFYCMNFKHVSRTVELVELLHTQGIYKDEYIQTFKNEPKKTKTKKERQEDRTNNFKNNWNLLLQSNLEYNCFSQSHVRICNKIDFWPVSGKWMVLGERKSRTGSFNDMTKILYSIK